MAASIRGLVQAQALPAWFQNLHGLQSMEAHQQLLDRLMREFPQGLQFAFATHGQRAWSLTWLVSFYGMLLAWVLRVEGRESAGRRVLGKAQALIDDRWMESARNNEIDRRLGFGFVSDTSAPAPSHEGRATD